MRSTSASARRTRRSQAIFGASALAALALGGALVATQHSGDQESKAEPGRARMPAATGQAGSTRAGADKAAPKEAEAKQQTQDGAVAKQPRTKEERIAAVREAAAKHTTKINYPLPPPPSGRMLTDAELHAKVTRDGGETRRLYSARTDLTGQKELAWVTEDHQTIGAVSCTDKVRFSATTPAKARPTLLICWRISDARSVYTVAVNPDGKPSLKRSVAAIEKEWSRMA
ncbi:putative low-complexity protein [Actinoplanes octamycinicus]|uniref:Putative low-complexity protein n=1 Tax=Actinoplanes octamycinicus TaxID=135948 RepID=A0A7W7MD19_9ACTN|nr:hypothetical protein [Actinoplanes octamycinicus]MBB4745728.1 putative low-complexity protein [Actinoplanes octamycinicus]GIE56575.1 hypothetical protein Aoc01nite_19770 [Actinoplanes octamycinicus]